MPARLVAIGGLRTRPPFSTLFAIDPATRAAIVADMRVRGFDGSKPIDVWDDGSELVVVDGHTRLEAARILGIDEIPVYVHVFDTELSALRHALHNQRDRRNWTDLDKIHAVKAVDDAYRKSHGGTRNPEGRNQFSEVKSSEQLLTSLPTPSRDITAAETGLGAWTVQAARTILADPEAMEEVKTGVSISRAADHSRERQGTKRTKTTNGNGHDAGPLPGARTNWTDLAKAPRDDDPQFLAYNHGAVCRSIARRAVSDLEATIKQAREQGIDIPALMHHRNVSAEWNGALKEARLVLRLIRETINGEGSDEEAP